MTSLRYVFLAAALTACATDDPADDHTSSTEQAVTGTSLQSHPCAAGHTTQPCEFDLGPASGRACFLAGLAGDVSGYPNNGTSIVDIDVSGGDYWLGVYTPTTSAITVNTVCVGPAPNLILGTSAHWESNFNGGAPVEIGGDPSTRCFLSHVAAFEGMVSYNDSVHTYRDHSGVWWITGQTSGNWLEAEATCFDATEIGTFGWGQTGGTNSGVITSNGAGGTACGLAEIGGVFESTAQNDGVLIDFQNNNWVWTFVGAKHAYADCIH